MSFAAEVGGQVLEDYGREVVVFRVVAGERVRSTLLLAVVGCLLLLLLLLRCRGGG
ncbi:MAG: hypothetical protein V9G04_13200 [Nocardioides sp.]